MTILALDIGDVWTGTALSDPLGITAQPYQTVKTSELEQFLADTIAQEKPARIVVGYPRTLTGKESEQTKKVIALKEQLENRFTDIPWVLWDERFTSKQAAQLKKTKTKEEKIKQHSRAAAFILMGYLEHLRFQQE